MKIKIICLASAFIVMALILLLLFNRSRSSSDDDVRLSKPIMLDVPFITQYPPGTGWDSTNNCGQTSFLMVSSYYKKTKPQADDIKKIDDWLFENLHQDVNDYNGSGTMLTDIKILAEKYGGFGAEYNNPYDYKSVVRDLRKKSPVIVSVLYPAPGNPEIKIFHAFVIVGVDRDGIYVNDPAMINGKNFRYSNDDFLGIWKASMMEALTIRSK
jgi:hypothetical protein